MEPSILHIIFFSLIGGVFSLVGGFLLLANKKNAVTLSKYATPFAAGALLAAAFTDLLPDALDNSEVETVLQACLIGLLSFFFLERFLHWFHHHHEHENHHQRDANIPLIVIGDFVHNFIDGVAIAAGFLVNLPTGIVVTLAVAAHEIPQEIGDFGLLLRKGMKRKGVILVNVVSALATVVAAVIFFGLGQTSQLPLGVILGLVAGFFIYIASSDIIPTIHEAEDDKIAGPQTIMLLVGVIIVSAVTASLHSYIEENHSSIPAQTEEHEKAHTH